jgi:hypothetical protein
MSLLRAKMAKYCAKRCLDYNKYSKWKSKRKRYPDSRRSTVKHKHKIKHDKTTIFPACRCLAAIESFIRYSHILYRKSNGRIVL